MAAPQAVANGASAQPLSEDLVLEMVRRAAGGDVDADTPLMEAGLDSLGVEELRNMLQVAIGGSIELPSALITDQPTSRLLTEELLAMVGPSAAASATAITPSSSSSSAGLDSMAAQQQQQQLMQQQQQREASAAEGGGLLLSLSLIHI